MRKNKHILEFDAKATAFHEASHYLATSHFKLSSILLRTVLTDDPQERLSKQYYLGQKSLLVLPMNA